MYLLYKQGRKAYQKHQAKRDLVNAEPHTQQTTTTVHESSDGVGGGDTTFNPTNNEKPTSRHPEATLSSRNSGSGSDKAPATVSPAAQVETAESKAATSARRKHRYKLVLGLLVPYFIASTDVTIVAPALPYIASHFNQLGQLNWIVTAFTIPSCAFIPVWGGLADSFGRFPVLLSVMVIMMIGAAISAGAQAWGMLLAGRGIMGVAAAGGLNVIKICLADGVTLAENARINTIFALIGGVSFGVGPVIGGYLTEVSWRWCFIFNVPVCALAIVMIIVFLRGELQPAKPRAPGQSALAAFLMRLRTVDLGGLVLFVAGIALIVLGTTWGGATYAWKSVHVIVPIALGGVLFLTFFLYEYLLEPENILGRIFPNQEPMIPLGLFRIRDMALLSWVSFSTGAAMYSIFYFVGIYFTLVKNFSASNAGTSLLYYLPGIGVGAYSAMFLANVWPKQTWPPLWFGSLLETVGFGVMIYALHTEHVALIGGMMGLTGTGTGLRLMPTTLHVTGIWPTQIARAMSVVDFCLPFGGTIALAMMGAVFNNELSGPSLPNGGSYSTANQNQGSLNAINALPSAKQAAFRLHARHAVMLSFAAVMPIVGLAVFAASGLGNVKISKDEKRGEDGFLDTSELVESRPFIWALIKGPKKMNESNEIGSSHEKLRK